MASTKPTILLVYGAWHTPDCFSIVKPKLEALSYPVATVQVPTSGGKSTLTWEDDVAAILDVALPIIHAGKEVVTVAHSYGGIPATASTKSHSIEERATLGKKGGFRAMLYIAAFAISARGMSLTQVFGGADPPWFEAKDGSAIPKPEAIEFFHSDVPEDKARSLQTCNNHVLAAFEKPVDFVASDLRIPHTYMICETDQIMALPLQEMLVARVPGMKSERCTAGHSPFLTQPDRTIEVIVTVAEG